MVAHAEGRRGVEVVGGVVVTRRRTSNYDLPALPDDAAVIGAVRAECQWLSSLPSACRRWPERGATANAVAHRLGLKGANRHGNGAVKGSWSGYMSPALRIAPRLQKLAGEGKLSQHYDTDVCRYEYALPVSET